LCVCKRQLGVGRLELETKPFKPLLPEFEAKPLQPLQFDSGTREGDALFIGRASPPLEDAVYAVDPSLYFLFSFHDFVLSWN
jgi:hypothetical protein